MNMDQDIKIAGDKPSEDIKRNNAAKSMQANIDADAKRRAKEVGKAVAKAFVNEAATAFHTEKDNFELILQRCVLLSFTATVGFEQYLGDDSLSGIAQKSFLDNLKKLDSELYGISSDMGAFSFYYLAFRRGNETERRIGQTFAMLCSHDGDPIFQELGEAIYCWFLSQIRKIIRETV